MPGGPGKDPARHRTGDDQTIGLAYSDIGEIDWTLAGDAYQRGDLPAARKLTVQAGEAFAAASGYDPQNKNLHFKLGLCYALFAGENPANRKAAKTEFMSSLSFPSAPADYKAYFELGMLSAEYYENLDDLVAAVACFEEVQRTHAEFGDVGTKLKNLHKALDRIRAQAATQPATQPAESTPPAAPAEAPAGNP